jgi:Flp pilus assembly protein TadD
MAGVLAAYVAFLVHAAADWDWQLAAVGLAGLACGAALLVMARGSRARAEGKHGRAALAATSIVLSGFALWSLHGAYPLGQAQDAVDNGQWVAAENHARKAIARVGGSSAVPWQLLGEAQTALSKPNAARASLRVAVRRDPSSWEAWYDLAVVSHGAERRTAANEALTLNPLGAETRSLAKVAGITPASP